ncbi:hypothetical protein Vadar_006831 [Vaccinium darrowii]|uniref:Uncharacterized protein n=1 Tax=Vaccinium darrowii TaxID=229202 RepID=A0ACB7ZJ03_9ERIC|nr:hypothetical protein Vadar_006831 [Vaccinium darrowii]
MQPTSSLLLALVVIFFLLSGQNLLEVEGKLKFSETNLWKSIQSEDGDVIDFIDIYKQPAFQHPLLTKPQNPDDA